MIIWPDCVLQGKPRGVGKEGVREQAPTYQSLFPHSGKGRAQEVPGDRQHGCWEVWFLLPVAFTAGCATQTFSKSDSQPKNSLVLLQDKGPGTAQEFREHLLSESHQTRT